MDLKSVAAVVPVYVPEPGLSPLVESLRRSFGRVIVVDDGSGEWADNLPRPDIRHKANRGKGAAIKSALAVLSSDSSVRAALFVDGDGQHRLSDSLAVARRTLETDQVTFGVRDFTREGVPFFSRLGNLTASFEARLLGSSLRDTQTGLRCVPARLFAELLKVPGERFEYECACLVHLLRMRETIRQVPIETVYIRSNRASHFRPLLDTFRTQRVFLSALLGVSGDL